MATDLKTIVSLSLTAIEAETGIGLDQGRSQKIHPFELLATYENGTGASQMDVCHSSRVSVTAGSPATIDLRGGLASVLTGDAVSFVEICWLAIKNKSSTSGQYITVGAGSNPVVTLWGASGDAIVIGPGGCWVIGSPIDGFGTTAGTGDIITVTAATGTIEVEYLVVGRSA